MTDNELFSAFEQEYFFVGQFINDFVGVPDKAAGISHEQWLIMKAIKTHEQWLLADLAKMLRVSRPAVSAKISGLIKFGYIRQQEDPTDRRKKFLYLTDTGEAIVEKLEQAHQDRFQKLSKTLGKKQSENLLSAIKMIESAITA